MALWTHSMHVATTVVVILGIIAMSSTLNRKPLNRE